MNSTNTITKYNQAIDAACEQLTDASAALRALCKEIVASGLFDAVQMSLAIAALQAVEKVSADLWECSTGIRATE